MAAYTKSITVATLNALTQCWNDVNDKKAIERLFTRVVAEFQAVEDGPLDAYTVTAGLQGLLEGDLANVSNTLRVEFFRLWITLMVTEFTAVQDDGLAAYAVTTSTTGGLQEFLDFLNQSLECMPDALKRINLQAMNVLMNTEFGLCEAAS